MPNAATYANYYRERCEAGDFFTCFDGGKTRGEYFSLAERNFELNVLPYIEIGGTCLDLGYGGGGMLRAAERYFDCLYGVDVHNEGDFVKDHFERCPNLYAFDGMTIPIADNSVDVAWSWCVFQHLGSIVIACSYLEELARVLKPGGRAVVYYIPCDDEYEEIDEPRVNICNLRLSDKFMMDCCSLKRGFKTTSLRPGGGYGKQSGIVFFKETNSI